MAGGMGTKIEVTISPLSRAVRPGPRKNSSSGRLRVPLGPVMLTVAFSAIRVGALSAEGEALHRLPTTVPMLRT